MNPRKYSKGRKIQITFAALALVMILLELGTLMWVREYLPGGIAPAIQYKSTPVELSELGREKWIEFDPDTLREIHAKVERDLGNITNHSLNERITLLRDWTRMQTSGMRVEITSRDPGEILGALENGMDANCEPLAILFLAVLESYEIRGRRVDLFAAPGDFHKAHSTVEAWNGNGWVLQDPTFNSVALGPNGEPLDASGIQLAAISGTGTTWVQDATRIEPRVENYPLAPSELYGIVFYRMHGYPPGASKWELRFIRLWERIAGRIESVIVCKEEFPIPVFITSGVIDRILLPLAMVFIVLTLLASHRRILVFLNRSTERSNVFSTSSGKKHAGSSPIRR